MLEGKVGKALSFRVQPGKITVWNNFQKYAHVIYGWSPREKVAELTTLSTQQAEEINVYESKQRSYETERRQLHNTIQELKGNIRVFCRIRPLLGAEIEKHGGEFNHIIVQVN